MDSVIIRRALETEFSHVTFFRTDGLKSFWKISESEIEVTFELDMGFNGIELLVNGTRNDSAFIPISLVIELEKKLIENFKAELLASDEQYAKEQKNLNQNGEIKMTSVVENVKVLENGVVVHDMEIENDFSEAQNMFEMNDETEHIDAESAYNDRIDNAFVATYQALVERTDDYERFIDTLERSLCRFGHQMAVFRNAWYNDSISNSEYQEQCNALVNCKCKLCSLRLPTMQEWTSGMYVETVWNEYTKSDRTKEMKLGKTLLKAGFEQSLVDFYSAQIKTEKSVFLTISDKIQHITGMSTYAESGTWNGYNGTSCQDFRESGMALAVAGSLNDEKLFIAMLHDNLDDLEDMTDNLKARVMMRLIHIDGEQYLIPTQYYGNNETKSMLHKALGMLNEVGIYNDDVRSHKQDTDNVVRHEESANGHYTLCMDEEVSVYETIDEYVTCDCPMCSGSGNYEVMTRDDNDHTIDCPMCSGSGDYEVHVYETIEEYVTVESEREIEVYGGGESYSHYGYKIEIRINKSMIERDNVTYGKRLV